MDEWKIKNKYLILCVALCFLSCNDSEKSLENNEKISEVKVNFTYDQVINIMGDPDTSYYIPLRGRQFTLVYESPNLSSGNFEILFTEDSLVRSIYYGD